MRKLAANRVVYIMHTVITVLTIAGFYVAAVTKSLPVQWQKAAAAVAGVIAALISATVLAVKFLDGSQKSEQLHALPPQPAAQNPPPAAPAEPVAPA